MKPTFTAVHVACIKSMRKGKEYTCHLLRHSYRENGHVKNITLANLSHLPQRSIDVLRQSLAGEPVGSLKKVCQQLSSHQHGNVLAVKQAMQRLGMADLLDPIPSKLRNVALALIAARLLSPASKLATLGFLDISTLAQQFDLPSTVTEDDFYAAMDWLFERQNQIEKTLARMLLTDGSICLYDLSSSYVFGTKCPLAKRGYSRDKIRGCEQIEYGLCTDDRGCPVAVRVFAGNVSDSTTLIPQVDRIREMLGVDVKLVIVADRGMFCAKNIEALDSRSMEWITALRRPAIAKLVEAKNIQLSFFDEFNLGEVAWDEYPDQRFVVCRNPDLAKRSKINRAQLIEATVKDLVKIQTSAQKGRLKDATKLAKAVGKKINAHKVGKYFKVHFAQGSFTFDFNKDRITQEEALDGMYVVSSSLTEEQMSANKCVHTYKSLQNVERAFRSLKNLDLKVRPIYHYLEDRVRSHVFLCMLAYYVDWHMRQAWSELTFTDTEPHDDSQEDPVNPPKRSKSARSKDCKHINAQGLPVQSFQNLLKCMGKMASTTFLAPGNDPEKPTFTVVSEPDRLQQRALELIKNIKPLSVKRP